MAGQKLFAAYVLAVHDDPAINATYDLFRGAHTQESAVQHCLTTGNPKSREQNASAILRVAPFALANVSTCYRICNTAVAVRLVASESVYVGIKTPMVRVMHDAAYVVMPGFRRVSAAEPKSTQRVRSLW